MTDLSFDRAVPPLDTAGRALDRASPVPLYLQIRQHLVAMISDWPDPEARFYTDEELTRHFDVAKATVRQALADLAQSGLLLRRRGSGTFVAPPLVVERLTPDLDIEKQYELAGAAMTHRVLSFETRAATPAETRALGLAENAPVVALCRLRAVAHVPVAIDERAMSVPMAERLGFNRAAATGSIIDLVRREARPARAAWELSARLAGQRDGMLLQIRPSDPILVRALTYRDSGGHPILTGETRHRSDMIRCGFEMDLAVGPPAQAQVHSWTREAFLAGSEHAPTGSRP
ncbi:MAG: GntR family transcriptional regulator [Rhodobacteraceae bacterium]|nr:GntR family transcriptional regulator [Paracoccaceae bacterium]